MSQFQLARVLSALETAFSMGIKIDTSNVHNIVFCGRVLEFLQSDGAAADEGSAPVDDASAVEPVEPRGRAATDAAARAAAQASNTVLRPPGTVPALRDNVELRKWICTAFREKKLVAQLDASVKLKGRVALFYHPYSLFAITEDYAAMCEHLVQLQALPCVVVPEMRLRSASLTADPVRHVSHFLIVCITGPCLHTLHLPSSCHALS